MKTSQPYQPSFRIAQTLRQRADELGPSLSRMRRYLHQRPELSEREYETSSFLAGELRKLNLAPKFGGDQRGVFADFGQGERRIAIRGDIDALPIHTENDVEYCSTVPGVMHACGHDAHATMVFGAASIIKQMSDANELPFPVAIRVIFQPAEESSTGGLHMIQAGALDGIQAAIALHVDPARPVGTVGIRRGIFTAGCELFRIVIEGQSGHSARPHLTGDTVAAAATWINQTHLQIPRCYDVRDPVVISIGQIQAGVAPNVIPSEVRMVGTLRSTSSKALDEAKRAMNNICLAVELTHKCQIDLQFQQRTPPLVNDGVVTSAIERAVEAIVDVNDIQHIEMPSMGAEDFSFMGERVPVAMFRLGVAGPITGNSPLHTPTFDIDEQSLPIGVAVLAMTAIVLSHSNS